MSDWSIIGYIKFRLNVSSGSYRSYHKQLTQKKKTEPYEVKNSCGEINVILATFCHFHLTYLWWEFSVFQYSQHERRTNFLPFNHGPLSASWIYPWFHKIRRDFETILDSEYPGRDLVTGESITVTTSTFTVEIHKRKLVFRLMSKNVFVVFP